ncbi:MAG: HYR domain-containing protein [Acidobacteria bacterium]|nr:HYR domain-containing protein [Acidobacteriota bacterium]
MTARTAFLLWTVMMMAACGGSETPTRPSPPPVVNAPIITCPGNVSAGTTGQNTTVAFGAPTVSGGADPVTTTCSPVSGTTFPLGTTAVSCRATDSLQRSSSCTFSVVVAKIPVITRTSFLAFGDSITAGEVTVPTTTGLDADGFPFFKLILVPFASYPTQLQTLLRNRYITQQAALTVVNAGVPGEAATDSTRRFSTVLAQTRPEVVLLLDGYNDLNTGGVNAVSAVATSLQAMAREARTRGARVFLANLTPSRPGGRNTINPAAITAMNDRIRTIALGENAVYVDLYQATVGNLNTYVGVDGLHLTELGYQRVAETFLAAIQATLDAP